MADKLDGENSEYAICHYDNQDNEWRPLWANPNSAILALRQAADMVERCNELLAKFNKMPCKQCADGEVEPDCPYFGEPCGCNSPTYNKFHNEYIECVNYILTGEKQ